MLQGSEISKQHRQQRQHVQTNLLRKHWGMLLSLLVVMLTMLVAGCAARATSAPPGVKVTPTRIVGTPTTEQRLTALVQQAVGNKVIVKTDYNTQQQTVQVQLLLSGDVANTTDAINVVNERIKTLCLLTQEALWQSGVHLQTVIVTIQGPILDQYADMTTQPYATATLTAAKAARFSWGNLTPDSAWELYDSTWLRLDFNESS